MKSTIKYGIDALLCRRNSLFGFGWLFHPDIKINDVNLLLNLENGKISRLPVEYGKYREDVTKLFPNIENAKACGFVVYGAWDASKIITANLEIKMTNGEIITIIAPLEYLDTSSATHTTQKKYYIYKVLFKRLTELLRQRVKPNILIEKIKRNITNLSDSTFDTGKILYDIKKYNIAETILIIDHELGGGANKYRNTLSKKYLEEGKIILLLTYHLLSLQYILEIHTTNTQKRYKLSSIEEIYKIANLIKIEKIIYNTAVSFGKPEDIPILLTNLSKAYNIPMVININDYFVVCPSPFLLNQNGRYCNVPDINICNTCLKNNREGFITLFTAADIKLWRKRWEMCLIQAEQILCFSASSKNIIKKAYPSLSDNSFKIQPHTVKKPIKYPKIIINKALHIGVVGHINIHKGAKIIQELSNIIKKEGKTISISIIGSIELPCDSKIVSITGPYKSDELPIIVEKIGANIFLMPSICPETFSYVTQELIDMEVPLVCFDIGAQAEKIKNYHKGLIISYDSTPNEILEQIEQFHKKLIEQEMNR